MQLQFFLRAREYYITFPCPTPPHHCDLIVWQSWEQKRSRFWAEARPLCSILSHRGLCWDDKAALSKQRHCGYTELLHGEQLPATRNKLCYVPWDPGTVCYCSATYLVLKIIGISRRGRPGVNNSEKCLLDPLIAFSLWVGIFQHSSLSASRTSHLNVPTVARAF